MERDLLVERTQAGLQRARSQGKRLGRPCKTTKEQRQEIKNLLEEGKSVTEIAKKFLVSRANIISIGRTEKV
jgi:DNA invertase Pin-like site-specific DNA recombinase